jgi:hypothetical protein
MIELTIAGAVLISLLIWALHRPERRVDLAWLPQELRRATLVSQSNYSGRLAQ